MAEETNSIPKPMVTIGGWPILWHIMKHYAEYGYKEFVIALGYKGNVIKQYFVDYGRLQCDQTTVDLGTGQVTARTNGSAKHDWVVHLVETGEATQNGGRIKRLAPYFGNSTFLLTWGDGVSDVNLDELLKFHRSHGKLCTVTAVHPPARFGRMDLEGERVVRFSEKPPEEDWINGAFFVLEPGVFEYIDGDGTQWEREPMERLARDGQLMAYRHESFWQCMDTLKDRQKLENLWEGGNAPWKTWE